MEYYATTKSDVYAMGVMFFKLITGNFPYVVKDHSKNNKAFVFELKNNPLQLKEGFTNRFSIKFHHFFELILKMVAKY
jgi:serine/threonine protein kinase